MTSTAFENILSSSIGRSGVTRVLGSSHGSRAWILAHLLQSRREPTVILCPNDDSLANLMDDLDALLPKTLFSEIECLPSWEQSFYSSITPSIKVRSSRASVLARLLGRRTRTLLTTLPALNQLTLSPEDYAKFSLTLRNNQDIGSRDALASRLKEAGYLKVDPVEDRGTFALRGEIVDLYPPDFDRPIRIELFDSLIERIRYFDPTSQKALDPIPEDLSLHIRPAREILINTVTLPSLRENLKAFADDSGISRKTRDPILEAAQAGIYPEKSEAWATFVYSNPASAWNYLSPDTSLIWIDPPAIEQEWTDFIAEQEKKFESLPKDSASILPPPSRIFVPAPSPEVPTQGRTSLIFDSLELASHSGPESNAVRMNVRANTDILYGTKHSLGGFEKKIEEWREESYKILIFCRSASKRDRLHFLLSQKNLSSRDISHPDDAKPGEICLLEGAVSEGFRWPEERLAVIGDHELLGTKRIQNRGSSSSSSAARNWAGLQDLGNLSAGDHIVHVKHGIGRYQGLTRLNVGDAESDFLHIEYANKDKLYLPVYRLDAIQKHSDATAPVSLDKLGGQGFEKTKAKVKEAVKLLAIDLVQLYAKRALLKGPRCNPRDPVFREFEARFPYEETADQLKAIDETLSDLESGKLMDRLICGDVGYGKTEVAMRAAYLAVLSGKQVAVLVPTTVLCHQHEQSFKNRFEGTAVSIESISRFKSPGEQRKTLERLAQGKVDIVIGTHRLLSKDVAFKNLGLVVVDEEHRFGVEHKEKLKAIKANTHCLTLTATPIPRTLHMALSGLRDITIIATPPADRLPIRTFVSTYDDDTIKQALEFELTRGGQAFFLHNRVQTIPEAAERVRQLVPGSITTVAHGQMPEKSIEDAMLDFYQKRSNILVCTTIIESGLDIPSANTMIIDRADTLGLAQLYQIRGRVGRSDLRGYCYLLVPAMSGLSGDARKRLEVIQKFVELGSGFQIASHDLEIRGGGNLLGPQQSGHIAAVGFDLYTELLDEAVKELQGKPEHLESTKEPEIKVPFSSFLDERYISDSHQRLAMYRRLSMAKTDDEVQTLEEELKDRFGPVPGESQNLLWIIRLKILLKKLGVETLTVGPQRVSLTPSTETVFDPVRAISLVTGKPSKYQLSPDSKFLVRMETPSLSQLYFELESLAKTLIPSG